jgi:multicomponent Na+:H+ antiporter subunit D
MNWTVAPIFVPLVTALVLLAIGQPRRVRRVVAGGSALAQLALAVYLLVGTAHGRMFILGVGDWPARLGIVLVVDLLSAIMLVLSALVALATVLYGYAESSQRLEHPLRLPLVQLLVAGINLAFTTGDLFNLFVGFELMLISSYGLLTTEADDWDIKQAYPYVAVNVVGSTLFLCAAGVAYGMFGTLNFAEIAARAPELAGDGRVLVLALLLVVVFGIKAGLFPLYYWLPNSYPTLPTPLAALFAGMLTKVGVYVLLRVLGTVLPHDLHLVYRLLAVLAGVTMILAVLGAISRNFVRGILSFHILSQIGFMVLAIGFFTPLAWAACIFYVIHHIIVKASLFLIGGIGICLNRTDDLERTGNLWRQTPWVGVLFLFQALSLAGLPPLSGFWGKYLIVVIGLQQGSYGLVAASLVASVLTLFSMLKIWNAVFWQDSAVAPVRQEDRRWVAMSWVVGGLTVLSLGIGLGAEGVFRLAQLAADQVLDQGRYAEAVLGFLGKLPGEAP